MARKTKQEAQQTREALLDAAEMLFVKQGVSKTTLQQIAQQANVTRGAVYWHFSDKLALFQAFIQRAVAPFEQILDRVGNCANPPYLQHIILTVDELFDHISYDKRISNFLDIIHYKTEIVDDFEVLKEIHANHINRAIILMSKLLTLAVENAELDISPKQIHEAALSMKAIMDGYFCIWMHISAEFDVRKSAVGCFQTFIEGLKNQNNES